MASNTDHSMPRRVAIPSKRRISRQDATVLPDVTNLPEMQHDGKTARRRPLAERSTSVSAVADDQCAINNANITNNNDSVMAPSACGRHANITVRGKEENPGLPMRAAKVAAKAKLKLGNPFGYARRKRQSFKVTTIPEIPANPPLCDEPMDIDNPVLAMLSLAMTLPDSIPDIDDHDEYLLCPEYAQDIITYLKVREKEKLLPPDHLALNPDFTTQMRGILVNWLIEIHDHEQLEDETLQLTVSVTDQYIARSVVPVVQLQLVGITAILIAAKYVERFPPLVCTLCALTDNTYSAQEVLQMEKEMLGALRFDLSMPLPGAFLQRFLMVHRDFVQVENFARYVIDLSLPGIYQVSQLPSMLAASALYVSRMVWLREEPEPWSPALQFYSGYQARDLADNVKLIAKMLLRSSASKYQAARQKHSDDRRCGAISVGPVLDNHPILLLLAKGETK